MWVATAIIGHSVARACKAPGIIYYIMHNEVNVYTNIKTQHMMLVYSLSQNQKTISPNVITYKGDLLIMKNNVHAKYHKTTSFHQYTTYKN